MGKLSFTAHGFRLRPVADVDAALNRAGLQLSDHIPISDGRIPAHLLISTRQSG